MAEERISFVTPYWAGREMMRLHLASIRKYFPTAPILVSKKGNDADEMESHRRDFGVRYWLEDCNYVDALLRLLQRCATEYVCVMDHDTVLLSDPGYLLCGLIDSQWDLVGVEERIREGPTVDWQRVAPERGGWLRFAPGYMDATFLMFNVRQFIGAWGLRGIRGRRPSATWNYEYHYGICQKLKRHKYLRPYHVRRYGPANLIKDGSTAILWHQWYGSYEKRLSGSHWEASLPGTGERVATIDVSSQAFFADYPALDLSEAIPAWGPECDIQAAHIAAARGNPAGWRGFVARTWSRARNWPSRGVIGLASRTIARLDRWRRFISG